MPFTNDPPLLRKPDFNPPGQGRPVDACAQAKCEYCGRYGPLGSCEGCGAPNRPVTRIDVTTFRDREPRYIEVSEPPARRFDTVSK